MQRACVLVIAAVLSSAGLGKADDLVENPEYTSWSKFKTGTSVSIKSTSLAAKKSIEVIITSKLIEVTPDKVVIETTSLLKDKAKDFSPPAEKREIPKLTPLPKGLSREDFAANKPRGTVEEGDETLKLAGLEIKTKWYKYQADVEGTKLEGKLWVSREIPGLTVKGEMSTSGNFSTSAKLELSEFKKE
jgi:hypothetical protein